MPPFSKLLIANRGEIALRILRSARALGYRTVAVHSEADADAPHVRAADQAVCIGPPPAAQSYLSVERLIEAARLTGADAVHPGYGFLSENADFAEACAAAGLVFVGPPAAAIRAMGNKRAAKELMRRAGVPCLPGYDGKAQDDSTLLAEAERVGLPLMVKAAAGGGGRGMRLVADADQLPRAIKGARSEALNAFGSGELLLERAVVDGRHVEIQVMADRHGNVIHLGERDCSIQRRHQKIVEESPSPAVDAHLRRHMGEAAVAAARAIDYVGAGTVEFLLEESGAFWFLEMNTRLQVEHPVTELVTGLDLVELQLRIAAGERLPLDQDAVRVAGHAIEVRLYAEDASRKFLPQTGRVLAWGPPAGAGLRVDAGIRAGQAVTPFYDPMLAKIIAHGADREEARRRLAAALEDCVVLGVTTNKDFLVRVLRHEAFAAGAVTTRFIEAHFPKGAPRPEADARACALAAVLLSERDAAADGWRSAGPAAWPLKLRQDAKEHLVGVTRANSGYRVAIGEAEIDIAVLERGPDRLRVRFDAVQQDAAYAFEGDRLHLDLGAGPLTFEEAPMSRARGAAEAGGRLLAPMSGRVVQVAAAPKQPVRKGQVLIVLEAMKMQHELTAAADGVVEEVAVREGDQVSPRQLLAVVADA